MELRRVVNLLFAAVLVLCATASCNQKKEESVVWKKQVARVVGLLGTGDTLLRNDTTLAEMLINAVRAGKITAYSNLDHTTPLTTADIDRMIVVSPDTVNITDPVSGDEKTIVVNHDFDYEAIHKYRILEEWSFNPATCDAAIHIAGVAPLREVFGADGSFRGVQGLFWVHYADIQEVLARYNKNHPARTLAGSIWSDYFLNDTLDVSKLTGLVLKKQAVRILQIVPPEDTVVHHLRDMGPDDTTLIQVIDAAMKAGKITRDLNIEHHFTEAYGEAFGLQKPDTTTIVDPVSRKETQQIITHELRDLPFRKYGILENWEFNVVTGNTHIHIVALAPVMQLYYDFVTKYEAIFWFHYDDALKGIITGYENTNHLNSFPTLIWNNYFYSDVKPTVVK